jgi:hypothetical protein
MEMVDNVFGYLMVKIVPDNPNDSIMLLLPWITKQEKQDTYCIGVKVQICNQIVDWLNTGNGWYPIVCLTDITVTSYLGPRHGSPEANEKTKKDARNA